ncbi:MAG: tRNA lysidine(34) synthetase TilS [Clostridia bacterium]|nr:tRNA lysidine(34) synthetase TilS [Clostridia bacterium]
MTARLLDAEALAASGIRPQDRVLVGLSGGADSVALLHALRLCMEQGRIQSLGAAHLVHGIRGESAERDAAFCERLCRDWDIPFFLGRADAPAQARLRGQTLEQAARELRYAFLRERAAGFQAGCIAVAHHADDQAETLLLHLMRGSGRTGLCGMRMRADDIARPLLKRRRRDIEAYLKDNGLEHCTDETNAGQDAARNRVRHALLPLMESFNPRLTEALCRLAAHMLEDEDYFSARVDAALEAARLPQGYARRQILALPGPLRARALLRLLRECLDGDVCEADIRRLEALLPAATGSAIELRGGRTAWLENEALLLGAQPAARRFAS